ncbi:hypothetical protein NG895_07990 [Aeoliella sp. ICT_H6.2]|uniref:Uncharacterized protein n=1 Tax=Aeoliella straminimaris TaxID=2954799 RepID=A0A9X2FGH3_9BACT|nr:hypothetical protein [Aeoliella straminimaris]MCO6043846.1 hypothetical protein [Aeoliella straminimaris]
MIEGASVKCTSADVALAVLVVTPIVADESAALPPVTGAVRGPYSNASRTLPAEFKLRPSGDGTLTTKVVDPCYSTSELKMEYELELQIVQNDNRVSKYNTRFELAQKGT